MSNIIECPACSTRYKLNKPIPEGGRHVKCARCGHQWRLVPAAEAEELFEPGKPAPGNIAASAASGDVPASEPKQSNHFSQGWQQEEADTPAAGHEAWQEDPLASVRQTPQETQEDDWRGEDRSPFATASDDPDQPGPVPSFLRRDTPDAAASGYDSETDETNREVAADAYQPDPEPAPQSVSWRARREQYSAAISTLSEPDLSAYGPVAEDTEQGADRNTEASYGYSEEGEDSDNRGYSQSAYDDTGPAWPEATSPDGDSGPAWEDYRTEDGPEAENELPSYDGGAPEPYTAESSIEEKSSRPGRLSSWASRILGRRKPVEEPLFDPPPTEADAETEGAIRNALNAALQHPGVSPESHFPGPDDDRRSHTEFSHEPVLDPALNYDADSRYNTQSPFGEGRDTEFAGNVSSFPFRQEADGPEHDSYETVEEEAPPFRLSGANTRAPVYDSTLEDELSAYSTTEERADETGGGSFENTFDTDYGSEQRYDQSTVAEDQGYANHADEKYAAGYDDNYGEPFDETEAERQRHEALDDDFAALQSELETTDLAAYQQEHKGGGGLAVVAAWAVFISVFSGVMLALINFRQDIMTALPGTTGLYNTLGFATANAGVDFADVRYRWTTTGGKPMIEVTGQVINVTSRTVKVPPVLVNVHDGGGADSVKAKASVPTKELAPRESASFSLEFLSPPENVAQIELEFERAE